MQFRPYYHQDYSGGLNDTAAPKDIQANEASYIRNWDITIQGKLVQRPGTTKIGGTISANPITGLGAYLRNGGAQDVLAIEGTNLNYLNASTWTQLANNLVSGNKFWLENVQSLGKIFLGNEDNQLTSWDRVSTTLNTCLTVLAATMPHGNVMTWHKNFMFQLNNVNVSGTKYPNRIYWSSLGDPTTYDTVNDFFDTPGDGRVVTCMDIGNNLAIFKERSIQYLSGWGPSSWRISASSSNVSNVSEEVGIAGIHALTKVGDDIWFIDQVGRVRSLTRTDQDAFRHDIISTKIEGTLSGINKSQLSKAITWSWNYKVYFAYPNASDTTNSILCVFDILAARREQEAGRTPEAWTVYDNWKPNLFISYPTSTTPDLYYGDAITGIVYKVDSTATSDNGTAISCRWDGKNDMDGAPDLYKNYGYGNITAQSSSGTSNVDVYASIDQGAYAKLGTLTATSGGSTLGPTGSFLLGPTGQNHLGGSRQATLKYQYNAGGLVPTGKALIMSIRHAVSTEFAQVNTWSKNFRVFPAR